MTSQCILAKKPLPRAKWSAISDPFNKTVWIWVVVTWLVTSILAEAFAYLNPLDEPVPQPLSMQIFMATCNEGFELKQRYARAEPENLTYKFKS